MANVSFLGGHCLLWLQCVCVSGRGTDAVPRGHGLRPRCPSLSGGVVATSSSGAPQLLWVLSTWGPCWVPSPWERPCTGTKCSAQSAAIYANASGGKAVRVSKTKHTIWISFLKIIAWVYLGWRVYNYHSNELGRKEAFNTLTKMSYLATVFVWFQVTVNWEIEKNCKWEGITKGDWRY